MSGWSPWVPLASAPLANPATESPICRVRWPPPGAGTVPLRIQPMLPEPVRL